MKRAILYARVSGDDRKYATSGIESQLTDCRKYAKEQGYQIVGEHFETPDKQTSGADWLPEIEKILKLAQQNKFDVLLVREIDRLARNRFKQMAIEIELQSHGIEIEYLIGQYENTPEGRLLKGLMGEFAEYEREKTRERTKRAKLRSVKIGNNITIGGSNAPYGYDQVKSNGHRTLVINEAESEIVRTIFNLYANELYTLHGICNYLDEHRIPKPGKGNNHKKLTKTRKWSIGTVSGILNNETYIGSWYYRKTKRVKKADGTYRNLQRPKIEWLKIEVDPIISEPLFNAVKNRRKSNKRIRKENRTHIYALSGILTCGHCGNGISGMTKYHNEKPYRYYKCNARHLPKRYGFKCELPQVRVDEVDAAIWGWVKGILLSPDKLMEAWENHQQQRMAALQPLISRLNANRDRLVKLEEERQRLIIAYQEGVLSLDDIAKQKSILEKDIDDTSQAIVQLQADLDPRLPSVEEMETIQEYAGRLRLGADLSDDYPQEQQEIYRLLNMEIRLSFEGGKHWADLTCRIGQTRLATNYINVGCNDFASL